MVTVSLFLYCNKYIPNTKPFLNSHFNPLGARLGKNHRRKPQKKKKKKPIHKDGNPTLAANLQARRRDEPTRAPMEPIKLINTDEAPLGEGSSPPGGGEGAICTNPSGGEGDSSPAGAGDGTISVDPDGGTISVDPDGGEAGVKDSLLLSARTTTTSFSFLRQLSTTPLMK